MGTINIKKSSIQETEEKIMAEGDRTYRKWDRCPDCGVEKELIKVRLMHKKQKHNPSGWKCFDCREVYLEKRRMRR